MADEQTQAQTQAPLILITGATGFIGSAIARRALDRGMRVRAMMRKSSSRALLKPILDNVELVHANMDQADSLYAACVGVDAVAHCAAATSSGAPNLEHSRKINVEGTRKLIWGMNKAGTRRLINISSQSARPDNPSVYGVTKLEQDEAARAGEDIDWTILKPSIVYGPQAQGIFSKMVGHCRKLPFVPIIGSGREPVRPVHVDDLANAVLDCVATPQTVGQTYDIGGAEELAFREFIDAILAALEIKKRRVSLPIPIALLMARVLSFLLPNPPLTPDNVTGIRALQHVDIAAAERDFKYAPRAFRDNLRENLPKA